jgi:DNA-directed RNA polymerase subunit RPC12/RpoP
MLMYLKRPYKIVRWCLNPNCPGKGEELGSTWRGEYRRISCPSCGHTMVFNPTGRVRRRVDATQWAKRDGSAQVFKISPLH